MAHGCAWVVYRGRRVAAKIWLAKNNYFEEQIYEVRCLEGMYLYEILH